MEVCKRKTYILLLRCLIKKLVDTILQIIFLTLSFLLLLTIISIVETFCVFYGLHLPLTTFGLSTILPPLVKGPAILSLLIEYLKSHNFFLLRVNGRPY